MHFDRGEGSYFDSYDLKAFCGMTQQSDSGEGCLF